MTQNHHDHQHDPNHDDATAALAVEAEAAKILEEAQLVESRRYYMNRSLWLALQDLGILQITGRDWVTAHEESFSFGELDHRTVQKLINRLQDLARGSSSSAPAAIPVAGQMAFTFEPRANPIGVSTHHNLLEVR